MGSSTATSGKYYFEVAIGAGVKASKGIQLGFASQRYRISPFDGKADLGVVDDKHGLSFGWDPVSHPPSSLVTPPDAV